MLKVVGASWEKTRLATLMLIAVTIIAVFAIFFYEVPLEENDGYYSASVLWSENIGFREIYWGQNNDPKTVKKGVARAYYKPDMATTGWSTLEIQTQPNYPDWVQAFAAGLLEGSLCWQLIYWHWLNTVARTCQKRQDFCDNVRKQLEENSESSRKQAIENDSTSEYWHQVNLFYTQLDGLETGWRNGVVRSRKDKITSIPKIDFLWMNSVSDLKDLEYQYNATRRVERIRPLTSIAFMKYAPNATHQFLLAHEAAGYYSEMLRLHKRYDFGYHLTASKHSPLVPGQKMIFTSYPATLYSRDDFYQISGQTQFTIAGVAITNYNKYLWNETQFRDKILMAPRVLTANRISKNGKEWGKIISWKQSGTGNKQWLVISGSDKHEKDMSSAPLALWVVEQIPGITISKNQTDVLKNRGYWINIGIPYYAKIQELAGYKSKENGDALLKMKLLTPVSLILAEGSANIIDTNSLTNLMRRPEITAAGRSDVIILNITNSNSEDVMSKVVGDNGFSVNYNYPGSNNKDKGSGHPSNLVINGNGASFHDNFKDMMNDKTAKDRVRSLENRHKFENDEKLDINNSVKDLEVTEYAGIIDLKVTDGHDGYYGLAGPPYNPQYKVEPFSWSTSLLRKVPHYGQVDVWDFSADRPKWVW